MSLQILANNQLDALFHVFIYFISLHVSGITAPIIRRPNCINTSSVTISLCKCLVCRSGGNCSVFMYSCIYLFHLSTCFGHHSAYHQETELINTSSVTISLCKCLVCRSGGNWSVFMYSCIYLFHFCTCFGHHSAHHQEVEFY